MLVLIGAGFTCVQFLTQNRWGQVSFTIQKGDKEQRQQYISNILTGSSKHTEISTVKHMTINTMWDKENLG